MKNFIFCAVLFQTGKPYTPSTSLPFAYRRIFQTLNIIIRYLSYPQKQIALLATILIQYHHLCYSWPTLSQFEDLDSETLHSLLIIQP